MSDISTSSVDSGGISRLLNDTVLHVQFVEVDGLEFSQPGRGYSGYASDGYWYVDGIPDPTHPFFKASWASEAEHDDPNTNRSTLDRFPDRIFVVLTAGELCILNADTLTVWMRFGKLVGASSGTGTFLGDNSYTLMDASFSEGLLLVATNKGLRIADFRRDLLRRVDSTDAYRGKEGSDSAGSYGVRSREVDGCADYLDIASFGGTSKLLSSDDCLCVDSAWSSGRVLAATGHGSGFTALKVTNIETDATSAFYGKDTGPVSIKHPMTLSYTPPVVAVGTDNIGWRVLNDEDLDSTSPVFVEEAGVDEDSSTAPSEWSADGVNPGDMLIRDDGETSPIYSVGSSFNGLTLTTEYPVDEFGLTYSISRPVLSVLVTDDGLLYFANGTQKITRSADWLTDAIDGFEVVAFTAALSGTYYINDLHLLGDDLYIATDNGVFILSSDTIDTEGGAERIYAAAGGLGTYEILEGDSSNCTAVTSDPETGHLLIATWSGSAAIITEVGIEASDGTALHQAFRFFDSSSDPAVPSMVKSLAGYRNASGPPDVEVS